MPWKCDNCESVNSDIEFKCEACGDFRIVIHKKISDGPDKDLKNPDDSRKAESPWNVAYLLKPIVTIVIIGVIANPIMSVVTGGSSLRSIILGIWQTPSDENVSDNSTDISEIIPTATAYEDEMNTNVLPTSTIEPTPIKVQLRKEYTKGPSDPYLWIRKNNGSDTNDCVSIQITGIDTLYWRLVVRGSPLNPAIFDGGGNARICDAWIMQQQGFHIDILNPNMDPVPGGNAPAVGGDIFVASWQE
jgi:hypothetical protein